jgi:hypothetical protein
MEIKVTLPYDNVWTPLDWAKENCPSYITNDVNKESLAFINVNKESLAFISKRIYIDYFFSDEKDAVLFALKFK